MFSDSRHCHRISGRTKYAERCDVCGIRCMRRDLMHLFPTGFQVSRFADRSRSSDRDRSQNETSILDFVRPDSE